MWLTARRTLRFLRSWLAAPGRIRLREIRIPVEGDRAPASLFLPAGVEGSPGSNGTEDPLGPDGGMNRTGHGLPAWIVLHGVTRPGRHHSQLVRFCRAAASTGALVVVPGIREWKNLELAPGRTVPLVRGAVEWLEAEAGIEGGAGLVGFSFGAPQAVAAAAHPTLRGRIAGVTGFGGYCDIHRTVRFQLTGRHELDGVEERLAPDPYGRWIMAANHLTRVPGCGDARDVASALWRLAAHAGDHQIPADSPSMQPLAARVRERVAPERRDLFDLLLRGPGAPPGEGRTAEPPKEGGPLRSAGAGDLEALERLAVELADAALEATPELDVRRHLPDVGCPVELVHGRRDRLVPYTESVRLSEAFPAGAGVHVTITGLFAHSGGRGQGVGLRDVREGWRILRALHRVVAMAG